MPRKVLISFLGTGSYNENRTYRTADYRFDDGTQYNTSFVASAIAQHLHPDVIILLGTVKSMWEEVYRSFSGDNVDEGYYVELGDFCHNANKDSELSLPQKDVLENAIAPEAHVELIRYGLNQEEIRENSAIVLGLEKYFKRGDILTVDITHSFRSLPLVLMNLLVYLRNVSKKSIQIDHVLYGMLDISRELGYTPVVELNDVLTINDWITGAYSLQEYCNGYKVAELIKNLGDSNVSNRLTKFSDVVNLNHLGRIRTQAQELAAIRNVEITPIADLVVKPIVNDYVERFYGQMTDSAFQFRVAKWQFEHRNYASAFLALIESVISYVCESQSLDENDIDCRERAKRILRYKENPVKQINDLKVLRSSFNRTNSFRNSVAHQVVNGRDNARDVVDVLQNVINKLEDIIK